MVKCVKLNKKWVEYAEGSDYNLDGSLNTLLESIIKFSILHPVRSAASDLDEVSADQVYEETMIVTRRVLESLLSMLNSGMHTVNRGSPDSFIPNRVSFDKVFSGAFLKDPDFKKFLADIKVPLV
jgi:hypothetical protein